MKKTILTLILATSTFISCSKEEEAPKPDAIIGTWKMTTFTIKSPDGSTENRFTPCTPYDVHTFNQEGSGTEKIHEYNQADNTCTQYPIIPIDWKNTGKSTYLITESGEYPMDWEISFSNDKNTMYWTGNDGGYIMKQTYSKQ